MNRFTKWTAPIAALSLLMVFAFAARAADKATGSISGTLVDNSGKPIANAEVDLFSSTGKGHKSSGHSESAAKSDKAAPVAKATTDGDGKFTIKDIPAGEYAVSANIKGQGRAAQKITVKPGETASVDLKIGETGKKKPA